MAAEYMPDEFLESAERVDSLFEEIGLGIDTHLGETAVSRHLMLVPDSGPVRTSRAQEAAQKFGKVLFPAPLRPAS